MLGEQKKRKGGLIIDGGGGGGGGTVEVRARSRCRTGGESNERVFGGKGGDCLLFDRNEPPHQDEALSTFFVNKVVLFYVDGNICCYMLAEEKNEFSLEEKRI